MRISPSQRLPWLVVPERALAAGDVVPGTIDQAHRGIQRVRQTPDLAYSFLRRTGLSVS
jgi:hypothetical protein